MTYTLTTRQPKINKMSASGAPMLINQQFANESNQQFIIEIKFIISLLYKIKFSRLQLDAKQITKVLLTGTICR